MNEGMVTYHRRWIFQHLNACFLILWISAESTTIDGFPLRPTRDWTIAAMIARRRHIEVRQPIATSPFRFFSKVDSSINPTTATDNNSNNTPKISGRNNGGGNSGGGRRANYRVREIMEILRVRTTATATTENNESQKLDPEWAKTRRYLYHRSELNTQQVLKVIDFLQDVLRQDNQDELVASVIKSNPRILRFSVENFLRPTASFLQNLYGEDMFLEAVRRNPGILLSRGMGCDAPENSVVSIEAFLVSSLGLKQSDLAFLKKKSPSLFQRSPEDIQSIVESWREILRYNDKAEEANNRIMVRMLKAYPTLFNLSINNGLMPRVDILERTCGLSKQSVASLMEGNRAAIFCLSGEHLREAVQRLKDLLGGATEEEKTRRLRKCVVAHPSILHLSERNLKEKISYFDQIDSMCPTKPQPSLASRFAIRSPSVYSLSLQDNIVPTVDFLAGVWGVYAPRPHNNTVEQIVAKGSKFEEGETCLSTLLADTPSILTMSLEGNLQPTINFYNRTGFTRLDQDWKLCGGEEDKESSTPRVRGRYLASSLFQRLLPRWHFYLMNKARSEDDELKVPPLHILAGSKDEVFCSHMGLQLEDFISFKDEAIPRLKFSSQFDTWLKTGRPIE